MGRYRGSETVDDGFVRAVTNDDAAALGKFDVTKKKGTFVISIALKKGHRFEVPDFGAKVDNTDVQPGEEDQPRQVCVSPRGDCFFIAKHIDSTTNIGNVYRREGQALRLLTVNGQRFDEACVRYCCSAKRLSLEDFTGGGRNIFLVGWHGDGVAIFEASSGDDAFNKHPDNHFVYFRILFDFAHQRFGGLHIMNRWH